MLEPSANFAQEFISMVMAKGVVDDLEVVEVKIQDSGKRICGLLMRNRMLQAFHEQTTVWNFGQWVIHCLKTKLVRNFLGAEQFYE